MPRPRSRIRYTAGSGALPARPMTRSVPSVDPWTAGEMFVSPHIEERRRGFAILCGSEAARGSSLTPHLLASRVDEPDLTLRCQIVHVLGDYFEIRGRGHRYPPEVRGAVAGELRKFERRPLLALVELLAASREGRVSLRPESLRRLCERIPNASTWLTTISGDRAVPVHVRQSAIELIGLVGFVDSAPALQGLLLRLEGRQAGQLTMLFAPNDHPEDRALLPALRDTLNVLTEDQ